LDLGFMLSYAAVVGLLLLYPPWARWVHGWLRADPWRLQAEPRRPRWARAGARYIVLLALVSLAACLATTPLTAHYFNLISPVALLANLAVVPAAGLMMVLGCLALVGGALWPPLAEVFNSANLLVITFIMRCTEWSAALPGGHFFVRSPGWWIVASYYVLLALIFFGGRRLRRGGIVATALIVGLLAWQKATDDHLAIHVWRLGEATVALVDAPGKDKVLINTGPRYVTRDLVRRLHAEGVAHLRALVLTRGTAAQSGGAGELLQQFPTRELWAAAGSLPPELHLAAQRQHIPVRQLEAGQLFPLAGGAEGEVFHPLPGRRMARAADRALIFRVARGPLAVLFLNDASADALAALRARPVEPAAPIVLTDRLAALSPAWLAHGATHTIITPASQQREVQEDQRRLERGGLRLWRLEEGAALHIRWPDGAGPTFIRGPSPACPIAF
jgi:beta-lactamase superfamily II metal-dependent hydrolase